MSLRAVFAVGQWRPNLKPLQLFIWPLCLSSDQAYRFKFKNLFQHGRPCFLLQPYQMSFSVNDITDLKFRWSISLISISFPAHPLI